MRRKILSGRGRRLGVDRCRGAGRARAVEGVLAARPGRRGDRPHRAARPVPQRGDPPHVRQGPHGRGVRRPARWPVPWRAVPHEGRGRSHRRRSVPLRHGAAEGARPHGGDRQLLRGKAARRGIRVRRQDEPPGARGVVPHRARRVRPDAQPVGSGSLDRWLEWRLSRRGRRGVRARGARERHGRIDQGAGECMRPGRAEAEPRPHVARPELR